MRTCRAEIQRAAATLRWTGSWHTVFVTVDRAGGLPVDAEFEPLIARHVDRYRMAGHDTEFNDPVHVSLEIDLLVCVQASHFRSDVRAGLAGSARQPHAARRPARPVPSRQPVASARPSTSARSTPPRGRSPGVASVQVTRFQRQGTVDPLPLSQGFMPLARLEIPRLDNDPNFPEHGVLRLTLFGGK